MITPQDKTMRPREAKPFTRFVTTVDQVRPKRLPLTRRISETVCRYGPLPPAGDLKPERLIRRLESDKKTVQAKIAVHKRMADGTVKEKAFLCNVGASLQDLELRRREVRPQLGATRAELGERIPYDPGVEAGRDRIGDPGH